MNKDGKPMVLGRLRRTRHGTREARHDCPSRVWRCDGLVCGSHSSAARAPASAGKCRSVVAAVFARDVEEIDVHVVWCDAKLV